MSIVTHKPLFGENGICDVCGNPSVVFWSAKKNIELCRSCAFEVLPAMLSDATFLGQHHALRDMGQAIISIENRYLKCLISRLTTFDKESNWTKHKDEEQEL